MAQPTSASTCAELGALIPVTTREWETKKLWGGKGTEQPMLKSELNPERGEHEFRTTNTPQPIQTESRGCPRARGAPRALHICTVPIATGSKLIERKETLRGFLKTFTLFIFAVALCFLRCVCSNAQSHRASAALIVSPSALGFLVGLAVNQTGLALQGGAALPRLTASEFS